MATIKQILKRAKTELQRVEQFVAAGGDLKSQAATTVGLDFMSAFSDVAKQFGYEVSKPVKKTDVIDLDPASRD
jgi:hypothetical protein